MKEQEVEDSEEFYEQLEAEELATLKRHVRGRKTGRNSRSNSKTDSLYKQALMDSIFGKFQEASKKLKLMITLTPDAPEPYHLLGTMHEENGELDKAAEYLFMSTYLSPPNLEKWLKVGDLSFERKMYNQAAYCFGRALKIASCDPKIMIKRAEAFELDGQSKKAIATYKRLLGISTAPEYVKKYAKLRFRRGEYSQCRQILKSLNEFKSDPQLIFMACQTHLKENQYQEAAELLEEHLALREETMEQNEQLLAEFIVILLVCSVALNRDCYGYKADVLLEETKQLYEDDYAELYAQALNHLSKFDEEVAFGLVSFLIKHQQHQSVTNYILTTDHLCKLKQNECISILEEALKRYPHSPELLAQRDYIYNCFGIGRTLKHPEAIFYSDQDEPLPMISYQKRTAVELADPQAIQKVIQNVEESLRRLAEEVSQGHLPGLKEQETVIDGLDLFVRLAPSTGRDEEGEEKEGLYIKKASKRRAQEGQSRGSIMNEHLEIVMKYFQSLVAYLQGLLAHKQWRKLIQVGEKVSKVHVFKNYSKLTSFNSLKIRIFEMSVLSCLAVNKFNTAMFFLRYLVTKHPNDELYVLAMHLLMRVCPKKTFISSALSKRLSHPGGQYLAKLLAIEYMDTGCFDLAISAFLRSSQPEASLGPTPQLCLAACLIQIASSRNTYNKLDFANRSAICLASYEGSTEQKEEALFNKGRWFAQAKLNHKAIDCFEGVLKSEGGKALKERAAFCLISIYRDCQQFSKADAISEKYFSCLQQEQQQE